MAKYVVLTSGTSWTVPSDCTGTLDSVELIGGGGGAGGNGAGVSSGGGGGEYRKAVNLTGYTPGSIISYTVAATGFTNVNGGNTTWNSNSIIAVGGSKGSGINGGAGGTGGTGGSIAFPGGKGGNANGNTSFNGPGGGGGSGGPNGPGGAGGNSFTQAANSPFGGGGGNGGGTAGGNATATTGGAGGNNYLGTGGGAAGSSGNGGAATVGSGGGGGGGKVGWGNGNGSTGTDLADGVHGSGGSGGGGTAPVGSGATGGNGQFGAGIIVIAYTPLPNTYGDGGGTLTLGKGAAPVFSGVTAQYSTTSTGASTSSNIVLYSSVPAVKGTYYVVALQSNQLVNTVTLGTDSMSLVTSFNVVTSFGATVPVYVYGGFSSTTGTVALNTNIGTATSQNIAWLAVVGSITNIDPATQFVQISSPVTQTSTTSATMTGSLSAFGSANNPTLVIGQAGNYTGISFTPESGYSGISSGSWTPEGSSICIEMNSGNDTTPSVSYTASSTSPGAMIALEVKAATLSSYGSVLPTGSSTSTGPIAMTPQNVYFGVNSTTLSSKTTTSFNVVAGNVYFISYFIDYSGWDGSASPPTVTFSNGMTAVLAASKYLLGGTANETAYSWYAVASSTGSTTVTIGGIAQGTDGSIIIDELANVNTSSLVVQSNGVSSSSAKTTVTMSAFANAKNQTYMTGYYYANSGAAPVITQKPGYTMITNTTNGIARFFSAFCPSADTTPYFNQTGGGFFGGGILAHEFGYGTGDIITNTYPTFHTQTSMGGGI